MNKDILKEKSYKYNQLPLESPLYVSLKLIVAGPGDSSCADMLVTNDNPYMEDWQHLNTGLRNRQANIFNIALIEFHLIMMH